MKNEFVTYVLYSIKYDKIYIGYTANLIERFKSHNYLSNKGYTTKHRPWLVVSVDFFESKKEAMSREKSLEAGKGREEIRQRIITNPIIFNFLSGSCQPRSFGADVSSSLTTTSKTHTAQLKKTPVR